MTLAPAAMPEHVASAGLGPAEQPTGRAPSTTRPEMGVPSRVSVSDTTTVSPPPIGSVPLLATRIVHVALPPALTVGAPASFETDRS